MADEHEDPIDTGTPATNTVPASKWREEAAQRKKAVLRVNELEARLAELETKANTVDVLTAQVDELKGKIKSSTAAFEEERSLFQAGITDPEAISIARHVHSISPDASKTPFAAWLKNAKEKPEEAPRALRPYLTPEAPVAAPEAAPAAPPASPGTGAKATPKATPAVPSTGAPATSGIWSAEQVRALREEGQRTGDFSRYKEARQGILKSIAGSN